MKRLFKHIPAAAAAASLIIQLFFILFYAGLNKPLDAAAVNLKLSRELMSASGIDPLSSKETASLLPSINSGHSTVLKTYRGCLSSVYALSSEIPRFSVPILLCPAKNPEFSYISSLLNIKYTISGENYEFSFFFNPVFIIIH